MSKKHAPATNRSHSGIDEACVNSRGGISGWLLVTFGIFLFITSVMLLIFAVTIESLALILISIFTGTFVSGFFILYPLIRLLFMGKDGVLPVLLTTFVEGMITQEIAKHARKKRK